MKTLHLGALHSQSNKMFKAALIEGPYFCIGVKGDAYDLDRYQSCANVKITRLGEYPNGRYCALNERGNHILQPAIIEWVETPVVIPPPDTPEVGVSHAAVTAKTKEATARNQRLRDASLIRAANIK